MRVLSLILLIGMLTFISCGDDGSPPVISIISPTELQTFSNGDTLAIRATVVDDVELASINLIAPGINETITSFDSPASHSYNVGLIVTPTIPLGDLEFTLLATDDEGMSSSIKRTVVIE